MKGFEKIAFIVVCIVIAVAVVSCYISEGNKKYSSIPEHEDEIMKAIRNDDYNSCDMCNRDYFDFELFKLDGRVYCHDCLREYFEIIYYEDLQ